MTTRRIDADVALEIEARLVRGHAPTQVKRGLERERGFAGRVPTLRTIQRMARDLDRPADPSDAWRFVPEAPDAQAVMWVLGASLRDGWRLPITTREADWIALIGRTYDFGPLTTRSLARLYVVAEARGDTRALDESLALSAFRAEKDPPSFDERVRLLLLTADR